MFCFQCEQTAKGTGCTGKAGMCGKSAETARCQDELTGALIGLARAVVSGKTSAPIPFGVILEGLFTTITNVDFSTRAVQHMTATVRSAKDALITDESEAMNEYDMNEVWSANEDIRSLKSLILFGLRGMSAYAYHAMVLGYTDDELNRFFCEALASVGSGMSKEELLDMVLQVGKHNLDCMALLDKANTESFGTPSPTEVTMTIEPGPFIIVTGHDLKDLKLLLEQTQDKGINVYTHGEMLPAHGYPQLRKYEHLKGNFGTAWQNQQKEFANVPAPILYTTNCLMPPKASYADRVFTTNCVQFNDTPHINEEKDFTPLIEKALKLGGYPEPHTLYGTNGGHTVTTGFGHGAVLSIADNIIERVKSGEIKHFFLVGGCDGSYPIRKYYTEFVKQTPPDTIVLTLACGKYRFNDIDLGRIGDLPRLMDMGQCNDAYSAIQVALALAKAFNCEVNDLPLSMVLSWYEQKAVCVLLTLLYLGIRNIRLGPTLPAFVSSDVLKYLADTFALAPTTTPEEDLAQLLNS